MFEWQKHSQDSTDVPYYTRLLEFINLLAQASETPTSGQRGMKHSSNSAKPVASFVANADDTVANCVLWRNEKPPLYVCAHLEALAHDKMYPLSRKTSSASTA